MATKTKKRFKEAEFVDQNETQAQAVPATDAEVAQAAPVEAAPVDAAAPAEDEAVLPEGTDETTEDGGVQVNPETVSVQVQIPVDQLGAAVAQATGDMEAANLSPDVQAAQEEELVSEGSEGEDIPVEGAVDEGAEGGIGEEGQTEVQLESKECGKEDKLTEETSNPDYEAGAAVAKDRCEQVQDMIDHAIDVEEESLNEAIEDKVISEDPAEVVGGADELPPGMDGGIDDDLDPALLEDGDGDIPGLGENDVAIDEDDPAVQDFLSKIDGYLADEEAQPAQVADALRASADFFDAIAPEEDADDDELLDVEEGEDEGEIPLDLDAIETNGAYSKTGDEVLDQFADVPEDYEESLVRVPCKFPKKKFGEKKVARDLPLVRENRKIKEAVDYTIEAPELFEDEDWDAYEEFDALTAEWGEVKTLRELLRFISNYDPDIITNFVDEVKSGRWESELYAESKKPVAKKLTEELDYSAVKFPAGSEVEDDNLVEAYEKTQASRRKAIKNFRESVIKNNENHSVSTGKSRFDEALRSSVRTNIRPSLNEKSNSWANNRFVERIEEREELDFKALIRDGFLG